MIIQTVKKWIWLAGAVAAGVCAVWFAGLVLAHKANAQTAAAPPFAEAWTATGGAVTAVDAAGNLYVAESYVVSNTVTVQTCQTPTPPFPSFSYPCTTGGIDHGTRIEKYSPAGTLLWSRDYNFIPMTSGDDGETPTSIVLSGNDIYLAVVGAEQTVANYPSYPAWFVRLDSAGNLITQTSESGADLFMLSPTPDAAGNLYGTWISNGVISVGACGNEDQPVGYLGKFDQSGNMLWRTLMGKAGVAQRFLSSGGFAANDTAGNSYVSIYFTDDDPALNLPCGTSLAGTILEKISPAGTVVWSHETDAANGVFPAPIVPFAAGNGGFYARSYTSAPSTQYGGVMMQFSPSGVQKWTIASYPSSLLAQPAVLSPSLDASGNVYVGGVAAGGSGFGFMKYAAGAAAPLWSFIDAAAPAGPTRIAVDPAGQYLYAVGGGVIAYGPAGTPTPTPTPTPSATPTPTPTPTPSAAPTPTPTPTATPRTVTISPSPPGPIPAGTQALFSCSGGTGVYSWSSTGPATLSSANGSSVDVNYASASQPGTYTVTCTDSRGDSASADIIVTGDCTITASPTNLVPPETATLTWSCPTASYNGTTVNVASSCTINGLPTINGQPVGTSGSTQVSPTQNPTTYTLSCTATYGDPGNNAIPPATASVNTGGPVIHETPPPQPPS